MLSYNDGGDLEQEQQNKESQKEGNATGKWGRIGWEPVLVSEFLAHL